MPLNVKLISTNTAVVCFFAIAIIGWIGKISAMTCCKRAVIAAIVAYVVASLAVKAVNAILISAMVTKMVTKEQENKP
jgi:hypothetical protein